MLRRFFTSLWLVTLAATPSLMGWETPLYDSNWQPTPNLLFDSDKLIQDFSYAGYRSGEAPIPTVSGPVFNVVTTYGADPTGSRDTTADIQAAINDAAAAGGGVVFLPAGIYHVAPPTGNSEALIISSPNITIRGAGTEDTFLLNVENSMRGKAVIAARSSSPYWFYDNGPSYFIAADLLTPTTRIPVSDVSPFSEGDWIVIRNEITPEWVNEHNENEWLGYEDRLSGLAYSRRITAIDSVANELIIDVPTRYSLKTRDDARIFIRNNQLTEVGIESLSIGNLQHPGTTWGEQDYTDDTKAAYHAHASWLIRFRNLRDSWVRDVNTFQATNNTTTSHLLSNGILLHECRNVTVKNCVFQRPQYGGGGGNGYMYRLQHANECLIEDSVADFSRHGFVLSHMGSSGNVFHNCIDRNTGKSTGSTGNLNTSGKGSDHHMHFSHSNLIDVCTADASYFSAHYRPFGSDPKHRLTSAHGVYWNTRGITSSPVGSVVHSQQSRYGYVIGTRGSITSVKTDGTDTHKTNPVDHVEGQGLGDTLVPFSLSLDQRRKRLQLPNVDAGPDQELLFPEFSLTLTPILQFGESNTIPEGATVEWSQISGPASAHFEDTTAANAIVAFPLPGEYTLECRARSAHGFDSGDFIHADTVVVTVSPPGVTLTALAPTDDAYVRGGADNENSSFGSGTSLWMKQVGSVAFERESYLKFDLSSLLDREILEATLILRSLEPDFDATGAIDILTENNWTEETLTWANRPSPGTQLSTWTPAPDFLQRFDLTAPASDMIAGGGILGLRLRMLTQQNSATIFKFAAKEHGTPENRPKLLIRSKASNSLSFADWINNFPSIEASRRGQNDDPEKDGLANLAEFFHNLDPTDSSSSPVFLNQQGNSRYLEFRLRKDLPSSAGLILEHSVTLALDSWLPLPGVTFEQVSTDSETISFRANLSGSVSDQPAAFFRLNYSLGE